MYRKGEKERKYIYVCTYIYSKTREKNEEEEEGLRSKFSERYGLLKKKKKK